MIPLNKGLHSQDRIYQTAVLCGGIGGSTLGYQMAEMDVCISIDSNEKLNSTHRVNFPSIPVLEKTLETLTEADFVGIKGELDILDVYIPQRHMQEPSKDQQSFLINALRVVFKVKPKVILMHTQGNVHKGKRLLFANEFISLMRELGYIVHLETLKASNYGIPQEKPWTFVMGVRKDIGIKPTFPEVWESVKTTEGAIYDLMDEDSDVEVNPSRLELVEKHFPPGSTFAYVKKVSEELELSIHPSFYKRDRWEKPYYSLPNSNIRPFHPKVNRLLSIAEAKRLQTIPDSFVCVDWKEICSTVPPLLMKQVAESIKDGILAHIE